MKLKSSASIYYLFACCYVLAAIEQVSAGFDLNEEPPEMEPESVSASIRTVKKQPSKRASPSPQFYAKVEKLFQVLAICDNPNFDLKYLEIPKEFSAQNKAIMALEKLKKSNLIKTKDLNRYKRTMVNCKKLAEAVTSSTTNMMSVDSQFSGGTYEERLERLQNSVLDNFRDRFSGQPTPKQKAKPLNEVQHPSSPSLPSNHHPVARLHTSPVVQAQFEPPKFIEFF